MHWIPLMTHVHTCVCVVNPAEFPESYISGDFLAKLNSGVRWNSAFSLTFPDGRKLWIPFGERRLQREKFDSDGCRFLEV